MISQVKVYAVSKESNIDIRSQDKIDAANKREICRKTNDRTMGWIPRIKINGNMSVSPRRGSFLCLGCCSLRVVQVAVGSAGHDGSRSKKGLETEPGTKENRSIEVLRGLREDDILPHTVLCWLKRLKSTRRSPTLRHATFSSMDGGWKAAMRGKFERRTRRVICGRRRQEGDVERGDEEESERDEPRRVQV